MGADELEALFDSLEASLTETAEKLRQIASSPLPEHVVGRMDLVRLFRGASHLAWEEYNTMFLTLADPDYAQDPALVARATGARRCLRFFLKRTAIEGGEHVLSPADAKLLLAVYDACQALPSEKDQVLPNEEDN